MSEFVCPQILAHRGASYYAPENTAAAIELAARQGAKWVEVDLRLTRDHNIVIIHNPTVTKHTNGSGKVIKLNYSDITKLDAGSWHGKQYAGQKILSLEELIELVNKLNLNVNLEIKALAGLNVVTAKITANILKKSWPENKPLPLISSYSINAMETIMELFPKAPRALLISEWNHYSAQIVKALDCVSVNLDRRSINKKVLAETKDAGMYVLIHTVNGINSAIEFIKMGVDGLFTDRPDVIIKALKENNLFSYS